MSYRFSEIAFTPSVQKMQTLKGSRRAYAKWEDQPPEFDRIGPLEKEFIQSRDGFYQGSVNKEGWPYIQFKGGPKGFLQVLDSQTLGYADFRGNVQYISVGNLLENDRVSLFFMDYANRRRLKVFARARLIERDENPQLVDALHIPDYKARVERAVLFKVEALDWNCPQHITPRFTPEEWQILREGM